MATISKKDMKFFEEAHKEATCSNYEPFKIGCVIVYKGKVIGSGHNSRKTCPTQKFYNRRYRSFRKGTKPIIDSTHAEIAAIRSVPKTVANTVDWKRAKVYVYRISPGKVHGFGMSRCCSGCMRAIRDTGIINVLYTTDDGYAYERLENGD